MQKRRWHLLSLMSTLLGACSARNSLGMGSPLSNPKDPDAALKYKFRGVGGGEKRIDAFEPLRRITLLIEGDLIFDAGSFGRNAKTSSYGGSGDGDRLPIPKFIRYMRYPEGAQYITEDRHPQYEGPPVLDVTVPVAERIPDDLLDDLRREPKGSLRLKLRLTRETVLIGWDIQRRPGFDPRKRDSYGQAVYVAPVHSFVGGDFQEARIRNGEVIRKGWYIHPKTGQRIETDF